MQNFLQQLPNYLEQKRRMIPILILQTPKTLTTLMYFLDNPQVMTTTPTKEKHQQAQPIEEAKTKATTPPMVRDP